MMQYIMMPKYLLKQELFRELPRRAHNGRIVGWPSMHYMAVWFGMLRRLCDLHTLLMPGLSLVVEAICVLEEAVVKGKPFRISMQLRGFLFSSSRDTCTSRSNLCPTTF
jgi:hypothetical protein